MQFGNGGKPTVRVSSSGDVQYGADITNGQTIGFDFQAAANRLVLRSDLQLHGAAVSENSLQFRNSGRTTAAIAPTVTPSYSRSICRWKF